MCIHTQSEHETANRPRFSGEITVDRTPARKRCSFGRDPELRLLRILMLQVGWNRHDLAKRLGVIPNTVTNLLSGNGARWGLRKKVNRIFASEVPKDVQVAKVFTIPPKFQA
jgi:hypothetical protein